MTSRKKTTGRRRFIKQMALWGGAGAFVTAAGRHDDPGFFPRQAMPANRKDRGYRLTAHIRKYYEKAAV